MDLRFLLLISLFCSALLLAEEERSVEDIREEAYDELDKGLEQAELAGVSFWVGGVLAAGGSPLSAATSVGGGIVCSKESFRHLKKSKELFDEARERESDCEGNSCEHEHRDFDSWDHDY